MFVLMQVFFPFNFIYCSQTIAYRFVILHFIFSYIFNQTNNFSCVALHVLVRVFFFRCLRRYVQFVCLFCLFSLLFFYLIKFYHVWGNVSSMFVTVLDFFLWYQGLYLFKLQIYENVMLVNLFEFVFLFFFFK